MMTFKISEFDHYNLSQFKDEWILSLEQAVTTKNNKLYIRCLIREKDVILKKEEIVRQLYLRKLIEELGYPKSRIKVEHPVQMGITTKSADICIFDKDRPTDPYILVELKSPKLKEGKEQLKSYVIIP
jgi:type I restriction enzyme M protein